MKIAFIISESVTMKIGDCLSSATLFQIYDTNKASYETLELPQVENEHHLSKLYSEYLKSHDVHILIGKDLGPKAMSSLDDQGITWLNVSSSDSKEDIVNQIINKK